VHQVIAALVLIAAVAMVHHVQQQVELQVSRPSNAAARTETS
jgi:hypothetical protein